MENLILSFNVVLPLFLTMALGYVLKYIGMFDERTLDSMNNVAFKSFLPILLFYNIYKTDIKGVFNPKLMTFAAISVITLFISLYIVVPFIEKNNKKRGVLVQGIFRSNFVIFGIPVTASLFGEDQVGVASLLIAIVVPLFNILSVFALEAFRGGKPDYKKILKGVIKNPLIIASCVGIVTILLGIKLPTAIENTVSDISKIATPLSLILLGGSFKFNEIKKHLKQTTIGVIGKIIVIPCIFIPICILAGYRNVELATLMVIFAAPTAVSSFTMAQQMNADYELAGQIVVFTSAFCVLTVFLWIFILKQFNLI
ncbi:AEC family transporter [Romboutsia weinsteinii]|uniref:AEC family transporter n=1 Tax=Romboutsia weinsteinii TaxID=2020949 RepID=A0A371IZT8_9FIRM|nr:AEC family transporter [Romboutsia weinsteinii]RDY25985.1 AEC family transporter [Romboutsia weinsteinii]